MPANLPPAYLEAERQYRQASTPQEKIEALQVMLKVIPHHKGTDRLIGDLRRRLSQLREEVQRRPAVSRKGSGHRIRREGAAQVSLVGPPNVGKSQLIARLTRAPVEVAPYPFTTQVPQPGMMAFENVQIQLIDTPAVTLDAAQGWLPSLFREADALLLIVDLSQDPIAQAEDLLSRLARWRILPLLPGRKAETPFSVSKGMLLLANKRDLPGAGANLESLKGRFEVPLIGLSALDDPDLDPLKKEIFNLLRIIRVYPKTPGKEADRDSPVILPRGSTVEGFAESIHKELRRDLKFARIWGSAKFDGQRVSRDYVLQDQDIVELHT